MSDQHDHQPTGNRRNFLGRHRQTLAYLVLAVATSFAIWTGQHSDEQSRKDIALAGAIVVRDGCARDYATISQLRKIITDGKVSTRQYLEEGTITQAQYDRAVRQTNRALKRLRIPDCKASVKKFVETAGGT